MFMIQINDRKFVDASKIEAVFHDDICWKVLVSSGVVYSVSGKFEGRFLNHLTAIDQGVCEIK